MTQYVDLLLPCCCSYFFTCSNINMSSAIFTPIVMHAHLLLPSQPILAHHTLSALGHAFKAISTAVQSPSTGDCLMVNGAWRDASQREPGGELRGIVCSQHAVACVEVGGYALCLPQVVLQPLQCRYFPAFKCQNCLHEHKPLSWYYYETCNAEPLGHNPDSIRSPLVIRRNRACTAATAGAPELSNTSWNKN